MSQGQRIEPTFGASSQDATQRQFDGGHAQRTASSEDAQDTDARVKGLLSADSEKTVDICFDDIRAVVRMARNLSLSDLEAHQDAFLKAESDDTRAAAGIALKVARDAALLADAAYRSLISSEADMRGATVDLMMGDAAGAQAHAERSGLHLNDVASRLANIGSYAPQSKFFGATLNTLARADRLAGRLESGATKKVEDFSEGLKAVAQRSRQLSRTVAAMPAKVAEKAKESGKSVASTAMSFGFGLMSRFKKAVNSATHAAAVAVTTVAVVGWMVLDESVQLVKSAAKKVDAGVDAVAARVDAGVAAVANKVDAGVGLIASHGQATMGLAGGLPGGMAAAGRAVAADYSDRVDAAQDDRATRRNKPR